MGNRWLCVDGTITIVFVVFLIFFNKKIFFFFFRINGLWNINGQKNKDLEGGMGGRSRGQKSGSSIGRTSFHLATIPGQKTV